MTLGPRDPKVAHFYGCPTPGYQCNACGRETSTYHCGMRWREASDGVLVGTNRRICAPCLKAIVDAGPGELGESFDDTFHPGEAPLIESLPPSTQIPAPPPEDGPDEACEGK